MRLAVTVLSLIFVAGGMAHSQMEEAASREDKVRPLCEAAHRGDLLRVRTLLRMGASVNATSGGITALMSSLLPFIGEPAPRMGPLSSTERRALDERNAHKMQIAILLMASGANVTLRDQDGATALHMATAADDDAALVNVVRELLRRGALVDARTSAGVTPLQLAISNRRFKVAKVLVAAGASLDARDNRGRSAADELIAQGSQRVLDDLRKLASDPH